MNDDIERLVSHCALLGIFIVDGIGDPNESWRALPDHLTKMIEEEEEKIKNERD